MDMFASFNKDKQRGSISVLSAIGFGLLLAFCTLVVDVGYARMTRSQLQSAADSASMAAVWRLTAGNNGTVDVAGARQAALQFAAKHTAGGGPIGLDANEANAADGDVVVGKYNEAGEFVPTTDASADWVRVAARRTTANGKPVELFFGKIFGRDTIDLGAGSTASLISLRFTWTASSARQLPIRIVEGKPSR